MVGEPASETKMELLIMFDKTSSPVVNIAREEELLRKVESGELPELVRFWVDSECLVRGRARSPKYGWYHVGVAKKMRIKIVERITGGGVVYHDEGNLNWAFYQQASGRILSPAQMFKAASVNVIRALARLGVPANFAPPNRIDVEGFKVSGMAARSTPRARLVHGTLLLSSDLAKLNRLCIPPAGCPPVANLTRWVPNISASQVVDAVKSSMEDEGWEVKRVDDLRDLSSQATLRPAPHL